MPKIICHMIASVDGRLYPSRWTPGPEGADISTVYETAASQFNAAGWMVGRTTMAEYADGIVEKEPAALRADGSVPEPHTGKREGRPIAVVFDPKGKLHYPDSTLPTGEHLVAVLSPEVGDEYLAELRDCGVSYVFEGKGDDAFSTALAEIERRFDAHTLLLEGGGIINGAFLKAGLINELSFLIYPAIDGLAGVSSVIGYPGAPGERPAEGQRLEHLATETFPGGVVWLRYAVKKS